MKISGVSSVLGLVFSAIGSFTGEVHASGFPATVLGHPFCQTGASSADCYEKNFNLLSTIPQPMRIDSEHPAAWSDTYWPNYMGNIAYRWQTHKEPWALRHPDLSEVRTMKAADLKTLSPAEKFDLYRSLKNGTPLDYSLTRTVMNATSPQMAHWEGICHGWSPASLNHAEPAPNTLEAGGVKIEFGSADIKALMDYYYGVYAFNQREVYQLGERCSSSGPFGIFQSGGCRQKIDAGLFHIMLVNQLGRRHEGFVIDIDPGTQVWNQPVVGVDFIYSHPNWGKDADGVRRKVHVVARMRYVKETAPSWKPRNDPTKSSTRDELIQTYRYTIALDDAGNITGGDWESDTVPDFIWKVKRMEFKNVPGQAGGDFAALNDLITPAATASPPVGDVPQQ